VLSTVGVSIPSGGTNFFGDLARELDYLHTHTSFTGVQLVAGTERFNGTQLPLG
jgi:hypothetical protein